MVLVQLVALVVVVSTKPLVVLELLGKAITVEQEFPTMFTEAVEVAVLAVVVVRARALVAVLELTQ